MSADNVSPQRGGLEEMGIASRSGTRRKLFIKPRLKLSGQHWAVILILVASTYLALTDLDKLCIF